MLLQRRANSNIMHGVWEALDVVHALLGIRDALLQVQHAA
jgi:hypothetical protein